MSPCRTPVLPAMKSLRPELNRSRSLMRRPQVTVLAAALGAFLGFRRAYGWCYSGKTDLFGFRVVRDLLPEGE